MGGTQSTLENKIVNDVTNTFVNKIVNETTFTCESKSNIGQEISIQNIDTTSGTCDGAEVVASITDMLYISNKTTILQYYNNIIERFYNNFSLGNSIDIYSSVYQNYATSKINAYTKMCDMQLKYLILSDGLQTSKIFDKNDPYSASFEMSLSVFEDSFFDDRIFETMVNDVLTFLGSHLELVLRASYVDTYDVNDVNETSAPLTDSDKKTYIKTIRDDFSKTESPIEISYIKNSFNSSKIYLIDKIKEIYLENNEYVRTKMIELNVNVGAQVNRPRTKLTISGLKLDSSLTSDTNCSQGIKNDSAAINEIENSATNTSSSDVMSSSCMSTAENIVSSSLNNLVTNTTISETINKNINDCVTSNRLNQKILINNIKGCDIDIKDFSLTASINATHKCAMEQSNIVSNMNIAKNTVESTAASSTVTKDAMGEYIGMAIFAIAILSGLSGFLYVYMKFRHSPDGFAETVRKLAYPTPGQSPFGITNQPSQLSTSPVPTGQQFGSTKIKNGGYNKEMRSKKQTKHVQSCSSYPSYKNYPSYPRYIPLIVILIVMFIVFIIFFVKKSRENFGADAESVPKKADVPSDIDIDMNASQRIYEMGYFPANNDKNEILFKVETNEELNKRLDYIKNLGDKCKIWMKDPANAKSEDVNKRDGLTLFAQDPKVPIYPIYMCYEKVNDGILNFNNTNISDIYKKVEGAYDGKTGNYSEVGKIAAVTVTTVPTNYIVETGGDGTVYRCIEVDECFRKIYKKDKTGAMTNDLDKQRVYKEGPLPSGYYRIEKNKSRDNNLVGKLLL